MALPSSVLLDTNVWLDAFDGARRCSREACELIDVCERMGIELLYAAGSAKDVYYLIGASLKRQARAEEGELSEGQARAIATYAAACVANMADIATAVGMDASDIWLARKYQRIHPDFEDCLVARAARNIGADLIVTRDKGGFSRSRIPVMTPDEVVAWLRRERRRAYASVTITREMVERARAGTA